MRVAPGLMLMAVLMPAGLMSTGCSKSTVGASRAAAEVACLDRFSTLTHLGTNNLPTTNDDDPDENVADNGTIFRMNPTGQFAINFPPITNLDHPYTVRCTGDINEHVLTSVEIDGTLHRPAANERWAF